MIRVAVLYGGISEEHEVSVVSARSVLAAIDRSRYEVVPVAISRSGTWLLPDVEPSALPEVAGALPEAGDGTQISLRGTGGEAAIEGGPGGGIDVVFPVLHGRGGEDGSVQGMLEALGVRYVGSGVAASAVGMDKSLQKPVFAAAGIQVTPWVTVRAGEWEADPTEVAASAVLEVGLPCFTKPAAQGSSIGVSRCRTLEELSAGVEEALRHGDVVLIEKAIDGRELECAVLGNQDPQASVVGEVIPVNEFYDYEAKYLLEGSRVVIPAEVDDKVAEEIRRLSVRAFQAIGCAGMARVDFFLSGDGAVYLNEINTIPGFTPISMYPKLWEASGLPYAKLIDRLIELALER